MYNLQSLLPLSSDSTVALGCWKAVIYRCRWTQQVRVTSSSPSGHSLLVSVHTGRPNLTIFWCSLECPCLIPSSCRYQWSILICHHDDSCSFPSKRGRPSLCSLLLSPDWFIIPRSCLGEASCMWACAQVVEGSGSCWVSGYKQTHTLTQSAVSQK